MELKFSVEEYFCYKFGSGKIEDVISVCDILTVRVL